MKLYLKIVTVVFAAVVSVCAQNWTDISTAVIAAQNMQQGTTSYDIGCGGVVANRLTGDVTIKFTLYGMWRTSDRGRTFVRIDQSTVGGRCESAWAVQCDQNDPKRMAVFSLDGTAAYTTDGTTWQGWTDQGRNWDCGAVNWDSPNPKVIFAARHEDGGMLEVSNDGGVTWNALDVTADMQNNTQGVMVGVIDSNTLLYSNGMGINRSTDQGVAWTKVDSTDWTRCKVAVMFKGVCYVGTTTGLIVSKDKGATWQKQGSSIDILQGPQFGTDENTMVITNTLGMYKSTDAGTTWTKISPLATGNGQYSISQTTWFGMYAWDPVHNDLYATAISNPANKKQLGTTAISLNYSKIAPHNEITIDNETIHSACPFDYVALFSLSGRLLYDQHTLPVRSMNLPQLGSGKAAIVKIANEKAAFQPGIDR